MRWPLGFLVFSVLLGAACQGKGQNTLPVWSKVESNTIKLTVDVPPDVTNVTSVQYFINGAAVAQPSTSGPNYPVDLDTTKLDNGVHTVKAVGNPGQDEVELLSASILVQNAKTAAATAAPNAYKRR